MGYEDMFRVTMGMIFANANDIDFVNGIALMGSEIHITDVNLGDILTFFLGLM